MKHFNGITLIFLCLFAAPSAALYAAGEGITVIENFDGIFEQGEGSLWQGGAQIVDAAAEGAAAADFGNATRFAKLSAAEKGRVQLRLTRLKVTERSVLSVRYRTETAARFGQTFKIYVDDQERAAPDGVGTGWRVERLVLPEGEHSIRFETENLRGVRIVDGYNAVYIDDITLFPDKVASIELRPRGEQHTWVGAEGTAKLRFKAVALLPDHSPKADAGAFRYSASGGTIDAAGVWTPVTEGSFTVTAALGNFSAVSSRLVAHRSEELRGPVHYAGTGKVYAGYQGGARSEAAAAMPSRESLTITAPRTANFDADAFFLLEGVVKRPGGKNYARVLVRKIEPAAAGGGRQAKAAPLETWYIVRGAFSRRIWLPFGAGDYQIEVIEFDSAQLSAPPQGEGMFRGGSYTQEPLTFTVHNTREETAVDSSGHWLYPSFNIQSDDFRIINALNDIIFGIEDEREKIQAIHDYLVSYLSYDTASFANIARSRKMDALSVLENKTGVCDGYSNLSAALLRGAGIPCRIMVNRSILHSWNQVWYGGGWKFYDATWDDPVPDRGPGVVRHTYFLLDSLSGGDAKHRGAGTLIPGDVE